MTTQEIVSKLADLCKLVESPANTPIAEEATASA